MEIELGAEAIFRAWLTLASICLLLFFALAYLNKIVVYRDVADLGWSATLTVIPVVAFICLIFIAGEEIGVRSLIENTWLGRSFLAVTTLIVVVALFKIFSNSIADNGFLVGMLVGLGKIVVAGIISILSISLVNYLFRDERKIGHVAIFFILFGIFSWFINSLINGDRVRQSQEGGDLT